MEKTLRPARRPDATIRDEENVRHGDRMLP
jgi:hypothetical protein